MKVTFLSGSLIILSSIGVLGSSLIMGLDLLEYLLPSYFTFIDGQEFCLSKQSQVGAPSINKLPHFTHTLIIVCALSSHILLIGNPQFLQSEKEDVSCLHSGHGIIDITITERIISYRNTICNTTVLKMGNSKRIEQHLTLLLHR